MEDGFTNVVSFLNIKDKLSLACVCSTHHNLVQKTMTKLYTTTDYSRYVYLLHCIFKRWGRISYKKKKNINSWHRNKRRAEEVLLF